jgi:hypothetical protein
MRKLLTLLIALGAIVLGVCSPAIPKGYLLLVKRPAASYTGPGDVSVNGSTNNWYLGIAAREFTIRLPPVHPRAFAISLIPLLQR